MFEFIKMEILNMDILRIIIKNLDKLSRICFAFSCKKIISIINPYNFVLDDKLFKQACENNNDYIITWIALNKYKLMCIDPNKMYIECTIDDISKYSISYMLNLYTNSNRNAVELYACSSKYGNKYSTDIADENIIDYDSPICVRDILHIYNDNIVYNQDLESICDVSMKIAVSNIEEIMYLLGILMKFIERLIDSTSKEYKKQYKKIKKNKSMIKSHKRKLKKTLKDEYYGITTEYVIKSYVEDHMRLYTKKLIREKTASPKYKYAKKQISIII
jgi:hypothetical protein